MPALTHRLFLSHPLAPWLAAALTLLILTACPMDSSSHSKDLPRFTELPAFDPHRKDFVCQHEAAVNPPLNPQAQALFEQAQALDDWRARARLEQIDYVAMARLYAQAAQLGHWKAQYNLATMYLEGDGIEQNSTKALVLTEDLMRQGIPAAWDMMGTLYMVGAGPLKADPTVAYAFWQRAADMGSLRAQGFLAKKLDANHDEPPTFWGNWPVAQKLFECAVAQGSGEAAHDYGSILKSRAETPEEFARALQLYHEGVKRGYQLSAGGLASEFRGHGKLVGGVVDLARAKRYSTISDRLYQDTYLRLPNLDKILPLPPAKLPYWDGEPDSLIRAAQGVRPQPAPAGSTVGQRYPPGHRAHLPPGTMLQVQPHQAYLTRLAPVPGYVGILAPAGQKMGLAQAPESGYWQAVAKDLPGASRLAQSQIDQFKGLAPLYFAQGERMQIMSQFIGEPYPDAEHMYVQWHYAGDAVALRRPVDALVQSGVLRAIAAATPSVCAAAAPCPTTGIWQPQLRRAQEARQEAQQGAEQEVQQEVQQGAQHPWAAVLGQPSANNAGPHAEGWKWQHFVQAGQPMPSLSALGVPVQDAQIVWCLMQATELGMAV